MSESLRGGSLVLGNPIGGEFFRPGREISPEPRGHLRFSRSVVMVMAVLLTVGGAFLTRDHVARGIENGVKSVANSHAKRDNIVVAYENEPLYHPKDRLPSN